MNSRRDFLKKVFMLGVGGSFAGALPNSIQRAFAIDPATGSTYLDAEHVVILMQENRSFDHAYGMLQGVRGFNDPRALTLPNGNPVWLQSNAAGETYAPFRLDIKDTKATWLGSLPHGWGDQGAARNHGKHDGWLDAKKNGNKEFAHVPLTLGYYEREDIPFYYALADAFTICDQNFCSSLTPTTPNRLHLWTGTVRAHPSMEAKAHVNNEDTDYDAEVSWKTFPERLEENGISWRIYQNEISLPSGLEGENDSWLTNFGDNPLEWFTQYNVRYSASHLAYLKERAKQLEAEVAAEGNSNASGMAEKRAELQKARQELSKWTPENFEKLSATEKNLHAKAFTVNQGDKDFRQLSALKYKDGDAEREMQVPQGDVMHQFREDVRTGKLPTVSWIVPPERFSDHPCSPWYGAWYLSETFDILTQNPEVWKKTIFILCYDENDGYFDHVPPFVPPHPQRTDTGKASAGIDVSLEHVPEAQEKQSGPIGLGFRVPLLIASPWSRGGQVCSQVFDHTSILMFLEKFLSHKTGRTIQETNITSWRRTVCGDLTSAFRPYRGESIPLPTPVERTTFLPLIHKTKDKPEPATYRQFGAEEIARIRDTPGGRAWLPQQEAGTRPSCALPYELAADGALDGERKKFVIRFAAANRMFAARTAGAPFHVYAPVKWKHESEPGRSWDYAVAAGDGMSDAWALENFDGGVYHLRAHGPNGFAREFRGDAKDPALKIELVARPDGNAALRLANGDSNGAIKVKIDDVSYGGAPRAIELGRAGEASANAEVALDLAGSKSWYDLRVTVEGAPEFWQRYSGRTETGREGTTDPAMGRVKSV